MVPPPLLPFPGFAVAIGWEAPPVGVVPGTLGIGLDDAVGRVRPPPKEGMLKSPKENPPDGRGNAGKEN